MSKPANKKRKSYYQSITVDVDIDESVLEENGYHHEDDCPANPEEGEVEDDEANRRTLSDWHDSAHGCSLWAACSHEPCNILTHEFRSSR